MQLKALVWGGLGSLADCADLDLAAWNGAFRAQGLDWSWNWDTYAELMRPGGDRQLAARFAAFRGEVVQAEEIDKIHQKLFAARLSAGIHLRPGVIELLKWSARSGVNLAMVSRSETEPVRALLNATARAREGITFDVAVLRGDVTRMAPDPDAMERCLEQLNLQPSEVLAIVDTPATAQGAQAAGIPCLAFTGRLARSEDFPSDIPHANVLTVATAMEAWQQTSSQAAE